MPDTRRTRSKAKRATVQTTLKDLFQKPVEKAEDLATEPVAPCVDTPLPAPPSKPSKPSQLFPIFTKVSSPDDTVTDNAEEPATHQPTPPSESSQTTLHPTDCDVQCDESDTRLWHPRSREPTRLHKANKRTLGSRDVVPFPSSCSQHVRGLQHSYTSSRVPLKRCVLRSSDEILDLTTWGKRDDTPSTPSVRFCRSLTPQQCQEYLASLTRDYIELHPAFAQLSTHQDTNCAEMWTRRFRPRRANEVLGNERQALFLRDWLGALELRWQDCQPEKQASQQGTRSDKCNSKRVARGIKRPRVVRAVTKKRGNKKRRIDSDSDEDDFVVFSDVDEPQSDVPCENSDDDLTFCQSTLARHHGDGTADTGEAPSDEAINVPATGANHAASQSRTHAQIDFGEHLTNTLLITGPPGCGKTAAVYACAEELGWQVFEVYPGIGRRNGANLDQLVGNVGKNHIVQTVHKSGTTKTEARGLEGYLAQGKRRVGRLREAGTEVDPIDIEEDGPRGGVEPRPQDEEKAWTDETVISGMGPGEHEGSRPIVGQSLVLLEEVDVVFKEDGGFWPAVVEFIRSCQRPVVMTCNDIGLVPVGELPLQTVLVFEPCASPVAATFLQCVSVSEGCLVPHEDLVVLYEATHGIDGMDGAVYPRAEPVALPDLRRSITQLQILCTGARQGSASEMHPDDEALHARRSARTISAGSRDGEPMASTLLWRQMKRASELMSHVDGELTGSMDVCEGVSTEETGYVVLRGGRDGERDERMGEEAVRQSRGMHEVGSAGPTGVSINPAARLAREGRVAYQTRMGGVLEGILAPPAPLMPQSSVFLDYIPWVRHMVSVDDELARAYEGRRGRHTRNSMGRYARSVGLGEAARAGLCASVLI